jgi:plasmid maintenance system antidote protein VapI
MAKSKTETSWREVFREACEHWDGSIRALARAADIDYAQLNRFIAGKQSIGIENAEKLGRVLGITLQTPPKQHRKKRSTSAE